MTWEKNIHKLRTAGSQNKKACACCGKRGRHQRASGKVSSYCIICLRQKTRDAMARHRAEGPDDE